MRFFVASCTLACALSVAQAFLPPHSASSPAVGRVSHLNGISEWRDKFFDFPGTGDDRRLGAESGPAPKEICILPFPYNEVLLQGETKQLRLYEDRFLKLFDHSMEHNEGMVAMGLLAQSGIIQTIPLCEIEAYNRMDGFGIFVTIRVVGRARLDDITQQEPFLKGVCRELTDTIPPNTELPNLVASNIEQSIFTISSMEDRYERAREENLDESDDDSPDDEEKMSRRIQIAKLEESFYNDPDADDDSDEEDEGDEDTEYEEEDDLDRLGRFRKAYKVAMATDTQGYCIKQPNSDAHRSPQELTALSWAAFCTDVDAEDDSTFRIQALDCDNLFERLKLASHMLRKRKGELQEQMKKAGLKFRREDLDEGF